MSSHWHQMNTEIAKHHSDKALSTIHEAARQAVIEDREAMKSGQPSIYGTGCFKDWKEWAEILEHELDRRSISHRKIEW